MAFGGGGPAGKADLEFTATTGPAKTGIEELRRVFQSATHGMSDDALKLAAAQDRLDTALVRSHGRVTNATRSAELNLRSLTRANEVTSGSATAASGAFRREAAEIERVGRGALVGSGLVRGLGRAAAFSSTAFLGGAGLVYAIRTTTEAAQKHIVREGQLRSAVEASGNSYAGYKSQIDGAIESAVKLGFTEADAIAAFTNLVVATGNVDRAQHLMGLSADVARLKNKDLADSSAVVAKAAGGTTGALKRLVPGLGDAKTSTEVLAAAQVKAAGQAELYAKGVAGAHERAAAAVEREKEQIGTGLLPIQRRLDTELANYLGNKRNQQRIEEDVNRAIKDGTQIVHGLVAAERLIAPPIRAAIGALGGLEHAAELAFIVGLANKAKRGASSLGLVRLASTTARSQIVADAAVEERALQGVATQAGLTARAVAGIGVGGLTVFGPGGATKGGGTAASLLKRAAGSPTAALGLLFAAGYLPKGGESSNIQAALGYGFGGALIAGAPGAVIGAAGYETGKAGQAIANATGHEGFTDAQVAQAAQAAASGALTQAGLNRMKLFLPSGAYDALAKIVTAASTRNGGGYLDFLGSIGKPRDVKIAGYSDKFQLAGTLSPTQQRAANLALHPDDLGALGTQVAYDNKALAFLEKQRANGKISGAKYLDELKALTSDRDQYQGQIDQINQEAATKRKEAASKVLREQHAEAAKAAREYRAGIATQVTATRDTAGQQLRAETKGIGTRIVGGKAVATGATYVEPAAEKSLTALLKKEANDKKLTVTERARYQHLYLSELAREQKNEDTFNKDVATILKKAQAREAAKLKEQQTLRDAILQNRLSAAQLAETQAGTDAGKLKKAQGRELAADLAILAAERKAAKGLTGLAKQENIAEQLATRQAIAQLRNQAQSAPLDRGANERQFLQSFADIQAKFGGNLITLGGPTNTHLYELVHEHRRTNSHLAEIKKTTRFPGTRGAQLAVEAAYG